MAEGLPAIRTNTTLINAPYEPVDVDKRLEDTKLTILDNGYAKIYVGDSKNGWIQSLRTYFEVLTEKEYENIHTIKISYNSVRPKGERLKTFGGTASGHEPLAEMFDGIDKTLKGELDKTVAPIVADDKGYGKVRPIHLLDIGNLIGANVVVGGVRRTAEIFLFDADDFESLFAKYGINGIWDTMDPNDPSKVVESAEDKHAKVVEAVRNYLGEVPKWLEELPMRDPSARNIGHRRMSNNSVAFNEKPDRLYVDLLFTMMRQEGEPGFVNLEEAARRVANSLGIENPSVSYLRGLSKQLGLNPLTI